MRLPLIVLDGDACADPGTIAVMDLDEGSFWLWVIWFGIASAVERTIATLAIGWRVPRSLLVVHPTYRPPLMLIVLWNIFTAFSIVLVATTMRSSWAVLFKAAHVATEGIILAMLLYAHRMQTATALAIIAILSVTGLVLSFPCATTITTAAISGLVLDSANFVAHVIVGLQQTDNVMLWTTIHGFGWHALYLLMYIGVQRFNVSDHTRAVFRLFGMLCNNIAIYVFVHLLRRSVLPSATRYDSLENWKRARGWLGQDMTEARHVWVDENTVLRTDDGEGGETLALLHAPCETGYLERASAIRWANASAVGCCHAARRSTVGLRVFSCFVPWSTISEAREDDVTGTIRVASFFWQDVIRMLFVVVLATFLWAA